MSRPACSFCDEATSEPVYRYPDPGQAERLGVYQGPRAVVVGTYLDLHPSCAEELSRARSEA